MTSRSCDANLALSAPVHIMGDNAWPVLAISYGRNCCLLISILKNVASCRQNSEMHMADSDEKAQSRNLITHIALM